MTTAQTLFGPYALRAFRFAARGLASSKCPAGAYRGVGMNAAAYATERMVDVVAAELGLDPLELRRRNVVTEFPFRSAAGRNLDSGDYRGLLDRLEARYGELRRRRAAARAEGRLVGIGIGLFNEHSGTGETEYRSRGVTAIPGNDSARVRVSREGRIEIFTSGAEAGQGHPETYRLLAARELGVDPALVDVVEGDTDSCPAGSGTFVSRGAVGGLSSLVEALREVADKDLAPGLDVSRSVDPIQVYPSGAHLALVEVDTTACIPRVLAYHAVEDCGTIVNHAAVEDQVRGGVAMGLGGVLLEEFAYGADGQPLSSTLLDYLVPLATDMPAEMTLEHIESPSPFTLLGSKGVGEGGTIGAFAAVANAVADAVAPLGVTLTDLPYSPDRIFSAIQAGSNDLTRS
jgi:aerobic carbon-monoxide dehydrogenase large subunit